MIELNENANESYKVGVDEVKGLKAAMLEAMQPIKSFLADRMYWTDDGPKLREAEYKSRDGFIAHSHNCGGIQIFEVIPDCEQYDFSFLEFGECDTPDECADECLCSCEGHLDASLQVFLKFEGIDSETGELGFYLILHGGNNDAPYFRSSTNIFETEFTASSVADFKNKVRPRIQALINAMK
jgi:hypothetical protein